MEEPIAKRIYVSGTVQGVFFRATTREKAREEGVTGWVRNLEDGRVEAHLEGPEAAVEAVIEFAHEGSKKAEVEEVIIEDATVEGHERFHVKR